MTGVISASTMPGGPMRAYVAGIREFFGIDHRFPPALPPKPPYYCRVTGRLDEKARGAQTSTPTRLASPQAGSGSASQVLEKSDKSPLCSRERLVNVQESS